MDIYSIYIYPEYYILYPIFEMQYLHEFLTNPSINWYIDRVRQGLSKMSKTAYIQSLDPEILHLKDGIKNNILYSVHYTQSLRRNISMSF